MTMQFDIGVMDELDNMIEVSFDMGKSLVDFVDDVHGIWMAVGMFHRMFEEKTQEFAQSLTSMHLSYVLYHTNQKLIAYASKREAELEKAA